MLHKEKLKPKEPVRARLRVVNAELSAKVQRHVRSERAVDLRALDLTRIV